MICPNCAHKQPDNSARCMTCGFYFEKVRNAFSNYSFFSNFSEQNQASQGSITKCPFCAEMIQPDAIKCRYCGEFLLEKNEEYLKINKSNNRQGSNIVDNDDSQSIFNTKHSNKWYKTSWGIIICIIFFYVSIPLYVWTKTNWSTKSKLWITVSFFLLTCFSFAYINNLEKKTKPILLPSKEKTKEIINPQDKLLPTNTIVPTKIPSPIPTTEPTRIPLPTVNPTSSSNYKNNVISTMTQSVEGYVNRATLQYNFGNTEQSINILEQAIKVVRDKRYEIKENGFHFMNVDDWDATISWLEGIEDGLNEAKSNW